MGLSENVTALATRVASEFKSVRAAMIPRTIGDAKGDLIVATGSDLWARLPVGATAGHVLTVEPASAVGMDWKAPPAGGSPSGPAVNLLEVAADRAFSTVTLADLTDWTIPLAAGGVYSFDAMLYFSSAATQTGFQFAVTPQTAAGAAFTPLRFLAILEYQTSATAWATFTQTVPTTPMAVTTASYVANSAILCRISGQVELSAAQAGNLKFQVRSEVAGSAITVRRGSPLRHM